MKYLIVCFSNLQIGGTYAHPVIASPAVAIGAIGRIQVTHWYYFYTFMFGNNYIVKVVDYLITSIAIIKYCIQPY